jgi:hypothetical protein
MRILSSSCVLARHNEETLIKFLTDMRHLEQRRVLLIWDGLPSHRSRRMLEWVADQRDWLRIERLPWLCARGESHRAGLGQPQSDGTRKPVLRLHRRSRSHRGRRSGAHRQRRRAVLRFSSTLWTTPMTAIASPANSQISLLQLVCRVRADEPFDH